MEYATTRLLDSWGLRPSVLDELHPDEIVATGFDAAADDWLDYFRAELACGAHALVWVFAAMACIAVAGIVVTTRMPRRKCDHEVRASESLEALA